MPVKTKKDLSVKIFFIFSVKNFNRIVVKTCESLSLMKRSELTMVAAYNGLLGSLYASHDYIAIII